MIKVRFLVIIMVVEVMLYVDQIQEHIYQWADIAGSAVDVLLTTGGTGFGQRDYTPEAILPLLHRQAPAIAQALITQGLQHTPLALLSRPVVGTRNSTLIVTLPGRYVHVGC
jgi:gephyrin